MKQHIVIALLLVLLLPLACSTDQETQQAESQAETNQALNQASDQVVVAYLHGNRRCYTCEKLETFSHNSVMNGFGPQLADGSLIWQVANFEDDKYAYLVDRYGLFTQSLIVSRYVDGQEVDWKNLDKIWETVGDEEQFTSYVQSEISSFVEVAESN